MSMPESPVDPRRQRRTKRRAAPSHSTAPKRTVVLAEDDAEMRALLTSTLHRRGYVVLEARDGRDAVEQLGVLLEGEPSLHPHLLISDVRMPGFSGLDILTAVRLLDSRFPVVLITAFGDPELHAAAARLGAAAVLDKPFDLDDLMVEVQRRALLA